MPPAPAYSALYVKRKARHVVPFRVMSCPPTALRIMSRPATPLPKTQVDPARSVVTRLPLFIASKQVLTVGAMYEIPCSVCIWNTLNHINKNTAQNVHARHLDVHFRPNAMRTQQDVHFSPNQG